MKKRLLLMSLKIRFYSSVVFFVCIAIYGYLIIGHYTDQSFRWYQALFVIFLNLICLFCIGVKAETISKYCDPLNLLNRNRYISILLLELSETVVAYYLAVNCKSIMFCIRIYSIIIISITLYITYSHKKVINRYHQLFRSNQIEMLISNLETQNSCMKDDSELYGYYKSFIIFIIYLSLITGVFKWIISSLVAIILFIIFNLFVLYKLFWKGMKELLVKSGFYFATISIINTIGLVVITLLYKGNVVIYGLSNRDVQEYALLFILFYIPISWYGIRVSNLFMTKRYKWYP